tara:strand:- start:813 stop:983 length:171 start_codon:yes stop_codon:yes gene_type:complete
MSSPPRLFTDMFDAEDKLEDIHCKLHALISKYPDTSLIHEILTKFKKDIGRSNDER